MHGRHFMPENPWVISVLSTDYDLHDQRDAILKQLQDPHIILSAFELPGFPVEPNLHSHDSCLAALDRVDIALLVIDKRYGGIYVGGSQYSITEKEYLTIVKQGKPCFVFVSRQTWQERYSYNTQKEDWNKAHKSTKSLKKLKTEFDRQYVLTHVETISVIDFVNNIQKSYHDFSRSNWIDQYEDIPELLLKIEGKLKGHSRFLLENLVKRQKEKLENRHTSTGLSLSLGDVFSRGYYLEPSFEQESGCLQAGMSLDKRIQNTLQNNSSVLAFGEAGYGKTTILAKSYLSHVDDFLENGSYHIPFYLWLKKKTCDYHFDFLTYINESFADVLGKAAYPYIDLSTIYPYFYLDGFDEIAETMTPVEVKQISQTEIFSYPILLTCRQQYAFRYITNSDFADKFGIRIKINTWDTTMAKQYIDNFCKIKGKNADFAITIHQLLAGNHALRDMLNSPLLITMLLWIVEQNRMNIPETIHTRVELFKICVDELANRELTRLEQSKVPTSNIVTMWSYSAWEIYYNNLKNSETRFSTLIPRLRELFADGLEYSEAYFEALFDSVGDKILGTFHEQFLEFFTANSMCIACRKSQYPFPEFLNYVIRPEINRYFRAILHEYPEKEQRDIIANLYDQYLKNLGDDSFDAVLKRVHAIYHIGRFSIPDVQNLLDKVFKIETHISVRLSLFFGVIKMGNLDEEQNFFELLTTDNNYNEANRGYHIAYYSDAIMGNSLPFKDNIQKTWDGTLRAFLRHFKSEDEKHYFLRRIDLVTMRHLVEARKMLEPLSVDIVNEFELLIQSSNFKSIYPDFQTKIEETFGCLKKMLEDFH